MGHQRQEGQHVADQSPAYINDSEKRWERRHASGKSHAKLGKATRIAYLSVENTHNPRKSLVHLIFTDPTKYLRTTTRKNGRITIFI
jgi:hypothetical protein